MPWYLLGTANVLSLRNIRIYSTQVANKHSSAKLPKLQTFWLMIIKWYLITVLTCVFLIASKDEHRLHITCYCLFSLLCLKFLCDYFAIFFRYVNLGFFFFLLDFRNSLYSVNIIPFCVAYMENIFSLFDINLLIVYGVVVE